MGSIGLQKMLSKGSAGSADSLEILGRQLIARLQNDDQHALKALNHLCNSHLCKYLKRVRVTNDTFVRVSDQDMPIIISETLFKIWSSRHRNKPDFLNKTEEESLTDLKPRFISWLNTIARNTAIDLYRKQKHLHQDVQIDSHDFDASPLIDSSLPNLVTNLSIAECIERVMAALQHSYPNDYELIQNSITSKDSNEEIAKKTEASINTLYQRFSQARKRANSLREKLC